MHQILNTLSVQTIYVYGLLLPTILFIFVHSINAPSYQKTPKGCRKLGLSRGTSNIYDEYDPKYHNKPVKEARTENGNPACHIKALFTYPIKSCAGIELDTADVVQTGIKYDRLFCFAESVSASGRESKDENNPTWEARTMRNDRFGKLALVRPEIWIPDPDASDYHPELEEVKSGGVVVISYPRVRAPIWGMSCSFFAKLGLLQRECSFQVPLFPSERMHIRTSSVKIWKDSPLAYDYGQYIPESFLGFIYDDVARSSFNFSSFSKFNFGFTGKKQKEQTKLTLFKSHSQHNREILRCAPRKEELGFQPVTGFADAYPLHLLNIASVRDVAVRCAADIPRLSIKRFRANIIIQGPEAFEEDEWKRIRVGYSSSPSVDDASTEIYIVCRTIRCRLPNVDPDTGIRHPHEQDRTMKSYRCIDRGDLTNACLGMQLVPAVRGAYSLSYSPGLLLPGLSTSPYSFCMSLSNNLLIGR